MIELSAGQEARLVDDEGRPLRQVRMGLGWDKSRTAGAIGSGAPDIDLDASAIAFAGEQLLDLAFYNNLQTRDGSVVHLGDNTTGAGDDDDEVITVDLERVHPRVDTIVLLVTSYQGHPLEWIGHAYCRLVQDGGPEIARFTLTLGPPETGLVMARLVRRDDGWAMVAVGRGIAAKVPTEAVPLLRAYL